MRVSYDWPIWIPILTILLLSPGAGELGLRYGRARPLSESEGSLKFNTRSPDKAVSWFGRWRGSLMLAVILAPLARHAGTARPPHPFPQGPLSRV